MGVLGSSPKVVLILYTNEKSIPFGGGVFLPHSQFITLLVLS